MKPERTIKEVEIEKTNVKIASENISRERDQPIN